MPVMGKSKEEALAEFRAAEILEAARKVFAEKGFHDATIDEVAEAAGLAKGTVYLYYRSKRDLYDIELVFDLVWKGIVRR